MNAIVYYSNTGYTERYAKALSKESGIRAYSLEQALFAGTLFPELDKPFTGVRGGCACGRNA